MPGLITVNSVVGSNPYTLEVNTSTGVVIGNHFSDNNGDIYRVSDVPDSTHIEVTDDVTPDAPEGVPVTGEGSYYEPTTKLKLSQAPRSAPSWDEILRRDARRVDTMMSTDVAPADVTNEAAAAGTSETPAKADHKHDISFAAPAQGIGAGNSAGSATSVALSDHDHTIRESGGQDLTVGAVADGSVLQRVGNALVGGSAGVFGQDYQAAVSEARATTTSDTPQTKVSLTTPTLDGTYLITWEAYVGSNNKDIGFDLYDVTNTTILDGHPEGENLRFRLAGGADAPAKIGGTVQLSFSSQSRELAIRYYNDKVGGGDTVGIQKARLRIWRIS